MSRDRIGNRLEMERTGQNSYVPALINNYSIPQVVQPAGDSVGLNEITTPLWRGKMTIIGVAMVGLLIGLGISFLIPPTYRARTSMQIDGFNNDQFSREINPISSLPNSTPENYVQNEVKLIESDTLAKRVADKLGISGQEPAGPMSALVEQLRNQFSFLRPASTTEEERRIKIVQKALSVRTSLQSQVLELFYDAPDPDLAARGANVAASEFVNLNREARYQLAQDTTDWLNKQAADLRATLDASNRHLQAFARSSGLVFAGKQSTLAEDQMRQTQDSLAKAEADRANRQSRYEAAVANPAALMSDTLVAGSPLRQYQENLQKMREDLAQLKTMYTPTNYKVERVQAQINEAEQMIEKERNQTVDRLRTEYLAAAGLERLLSASQNTQLKTVEQQMDKERRYEVEKSEIDATQRLYESMLQKVKEAGAASALRTTNVRMIDAASVPSLPYSPNYPLNMALGFAVGSLGGIGLVLMRAGSRKVRQPGESTQLDIPELGVIPSAKDAYVLDRAGRSLIGFKGRARELGLVTSDQNHSVLAESFRATLTSVMFGAGLHRGPRLKPTEGRVLAVTSIDVMEGKTTVVTNLGIAAAERKQRVLLIDADLRRPRLHEVIDLPNTWGFTDLLHSQDLADVADTSPLDALVRPTRIPGLWVLPSGPVDGATPSLLYSSDLRVLLDRFRKEFDLVLIDTPPMMLYADVRELGRVSDGVVMVVRANTKSPEELRDAYVKFIQDQIPVLGTILNDWKMDTSKARAYSRYHTHYRPRPA
ncbi:MAG TPA: polysaccharide biosynthesis tyrosine autokinase [Bryobacteraceae bacterium]|nr:polysaccharide biosynthesis tyrosine autokinase [Bryobacteraceae bacterium]